MNTRKLTVGLIQLRCSAEPERNLTAVIEGIRKAVTRGARMIHDLTSFLYTVWFPVTGKASDRAPLWPNSPPLPAP